MITSHDEKIILTLNQLLMVLHQHDQGKIVRKIMQPAHDVALRLLGIDHPIENLTRMMVKAADPQYLIDHGEEHGITAELMRTAWEACVTICDKRENDLRSIGALYAYGFMLNLESQQKRYAAMKTQKLTECERVLTHCYGLSCARLGKKHLQSIQCLIGLRLCFERLERTEDAIRVAQQALDDSEDTLGRSHPRRLEVMRGLAVTLSERLDDGDEVRVKNLYWEILQGRVRMLGRQHRFTLASKRDYIAWLQWMEIWKEPGEGECHERDEVEDLFEWDMMESDSEGEVNCAF